MVRLKTAMEREMTFSTLSIAVVPQTANGAKSPITRPLHVVNATGAFAVVHRGALALVTQTSPTSGTINLGEAKLDKSAGRPAKMADLGIVPIAKVAVAPVAPVAPSVEPEAPFNPTRHAALFRANEAKLAKHGASSKQGRSASKAMGTISAKLTRFGFNVDGTPIAAAPAAPANAVRIAQMSVDAGIDPTALIEALVSHIKG